MMNIDVAGDILAQGLKLVLMIAAVAIVPSLITGLLEEMGHQAQETLQPPRPLAAE